MTQVRQTSAHESIVDGTGPLPPGASVFRSDVEGLRAVAVLLVLFYHAELGGFTGGFIGVDVFFVLSGFLITSLLIREATDGSAPSLRNFYARRVRRLLPVAFVVTVAVVLSAYRWLGFLRADVIASDARWSAAFLANWHFAHVGTNYLTSLDSPSPLQHFWSLAVEEQFYLVWPGLVVLVSVTLRRYSLRLRLAAVLVPICVASLIWSVMETGSNATMAFFSSFTRAWELGVGALLAVVAPALTRIRPAAAAVLTWLGLAAVVVSAFAYDNTTKFPGLAAAVPVGGTLLALIGGSVRHRWSAGIILDRAPMQWLGKLSYSLYLWHWPLIVIVAEYYGDPQPKPVNAMLLVLALVLSVISFYVVENPIRHSPLLMRRSTVTLGFGLILVAASLGVATWTLSRHGGI